MKIVYDATPLLMRSAGVKNYHHSLLVRLLPRMRPHLLTLFPFLPSVGHNHNERSNFGRAATLWRLMAVLADNYLGVPAGRIAARGAGLFHVTNHLMRPPGGVRLTSFVHDVTPLLMPEFHTASNVRYFRHFADRVLPRLDGIIVPSGSVKQDLVRDLKTPEDRITVIPHGVDEDFFPSSAPEPKRSAYDLPEQYILFLGSMEPRKNLTVLLDAYAALPADLRRAYPLVIAGASGWKNSQLHRRIEEARSSGARVIGYVEPQALPLVYRGAAVFVFPSLYEGFGMPLLEAMAAGAPVVTSNVASMPEVVGDAGILVDPRSSTEVGTAIERVLSDPALAAGLREKGRLRATQFTWEKTAVATKAFFQRMLE